MRKRNLYLLMFLMLFVVIGGVFATWIYSNDIANVEDLQTEIQVEDCEVSGGTISVDSNNIIIKVDQADAEYNAKLVGTGNLVLKYTPAEGNIATEGPSAQIAIELTDTGGNSGITVNTENFDITWNGLDATITGEELACKLAISKKLADYDAYKTYKAGLNITIKLTISAK